MEMLKKKQAEKQAELKKLRTKSRNPKKSTFRNRLKNINVKTTEEIEAWERNNKAVAPASVKPIQLDLFGHCDDDSAAMPNAIARSALFSPIARGRRRFIDNELIASRKDVKITFTGIQLDMGDADVFMQAIRLAAEQGFLDLDTEFQILPYGFLKELGRCCKTKPGKGNLLWLQKSFMRLRKGLLIIETNECIFTPSLILDYTYNKTTGTHHLKLDSRIISLFYNEQYGLIDWDKRKNIKKEISLAKWLQTYIASNAKGQQIISIKKIKKWCGKENRQSSKFRNSLKKALKELEKLKIIKNSNIDKKGIVKYIRL